MPPTLLNAIDFVYSEWNYKPASFVSYGGVSGGLRSTQMAKVPLTSVKVMPIFEQVDELRLQQLAEGDVRRRTTRTRRRRPCSPSSTDRPLALKPSCEAKP